MHDVLIFLIIFGSIIVGIAIIGGLLIAALKIVRGEAGPRNKMQSAEEARIMQEIFHGLQRMEERIETLETIMMEQKQKEKYHE